MTPSNATRRQSKAVRPAGGTARRVVRIRILADSAVAIGPGKADLLGAIANTGSISAAGRATGMSYRRAWLLVRTMNDCFARPVVVATKGGTSGGGAELTFAGRDVLRCYRKLAAGAEAAFRPHLR
jgi:molybdate transport system regulatory protein